MLQLWKPDMVRFMRDASEHESYNQKIAGEILPHLAPGAHVCDAGCGLGYLTLELAQHGFPVTAVDLNEDALDVLRENCAARNLQNVTVRCGDISSLLPEAPYDAMVFCFFGGIDEILRVAAQQCRGDVFIISRNYSLHRFSVKAHGCGKGGYLDMTRVLTGLKIPFHAHAMSLPFGQPLRSLEDARLFFAQYSKDESALVTDEFLRSRITETDDKEFPYYMPHRRDIGILHLQAADIRRQLAAQQEKPWMPQTAMA